MVMLVTVGFVLQLLEGKKGRTSSSKYFQYECVITMGSSLIL